MDDFDEFNRLMREQVGIIWRIVDAIDKLAVAVADECKPDVIVDGRLQ